MIGGIVRVFLGQLKPQSCQRVTVSNLISDYNLNTINLLKIDVERAELDVLRGIDDKDWGKIQQVVVEVHEANDTTSQILNILKKQGFEDIVCTQDQQMHGTNLYMIYAIRRDYSTQ
eukprot:TRINITY_DN3437_c0_g1_i2.p4 TRINITY_DN3437_c0_g1~~TRINITY_DN3437_c0_g1_i2.p4  ORF type:complete len:117 (-),score=11.98 TRINITY_DN3437_c0_g1_i2:210-560(-)